MNTKPKPAALNHALLSRQAIDSSALAVRGVLMHRFALPGRYEVYASRAGRVVHRELIEVAQDDGATQLDVRLGLLELSPPLSASTTATKSSGCRRMLQVADTDAVDEDAHVGPQQVLLVDTRKRRPG
jgi:hypothetical protein